MSSLDSWLQPLRAYPRGFVLACFAITLGAIIWTIAKALKWSVYTMAMLVFAALTGGFALWLWA
ncbi:MAG: hypothetical protein ABW223_13145 [Rariglobus sp.]